MTNQKYKTTEISKIKEGLYLARFKKLNNKWVIIEVTIRKDAAFLIGEEWEWAISEFYDFIPFTIQEILSKNEVNNA